MTPIGPVTARTQVDGATPVEQPNPGKPLALVRREKEPDEPSKLELLPPSKPPSLAYRVAHRAFRAFIMTYCDVAVKGELPKDTGFVLASNHPSMADGPIIQSLDPRIQCVAVPQDVKFFQVFMEWVGSYFTDKKREMYTRTNADLRGGNVVWIAVEGRCNRFQIKEAKAGAWAMAKEAGVPIVPMAVSDTSTAWNTLGKIWTWRPWRRPKITVEFGKPVMPGDDKTVARTRLRDSVRALQARVGVPAAPGCALASAEASLGKKTGPILAGGRAALEKID
ncbi:MAG: lysophospholipid acyltransferase family protein [Myxococcota bacterium]